MGLLHALIIPARKGLLPFLLFLIRIDTVQPLADGLPFFDKREGAWAESVGDALSFPSLGETPAASSRLPVRKHPERRQKNLIDWPCESR